MLSTKQLVRRSLHFVLSVNLVFVTLAPAFSTPVFASTKATENNQTPIISQNPANIQPLEKPVDIEPAPDPTIQPIDIGQIKPVEIIPEEIVPEENKLPTEDANRDGEEPEPYIQKDEIKSLTDKLNINTDTNTGAFNYNYPLEVPQGRNNLQPDLALSYNNQDTNNQNIFGYGWSLNIPSVERLNKTGIDNLYTDNYFTSSLGGELAAISLSDDIHGTYGPRVENGDFLKYEYTTSSTWLITDKMGTIYTFGKLALDRQDDPTDNTKIYKWMLSEVRDTNDNFIRYQYYKDAGQIYPEKIFYTGHAQTDGIFEVEFVREDRTDNLSSFQTGFSVTNNYRFSQILVKINNQWQKKYYLNYETGDNGNRSLLSGIQQAAPSPEQGLEATMPEEEFDYQSDRSGWVYSPNYDTFIENPYAPFDGPYPVLGDFNGDNLLDLITCTQSVCRVQINNNGNGWSVDLGYVLPLEISYNAIAIDLNGDGLADLMTRFNYDFRSWINNGDGSWSRNTNYDAFYVFNSNNNSYSLPIGDFNGDGLPDFFYAADNTGVYINSGNGWIASGEYDSRNGIANYSYATDVNGDNLSDFITQDQSDILVYINNGDATGWTHSPEYSFDIGDDNQYTAIGDLNNDGLVDFMHVSSSQNCGFYINNGDGSGWLNDNVNYVFPNNFGCGSHAVDINSDGLSDLLYKSNDQLTVAINTGKSADFLFQIQNSNGSFIDLEYQSSVQYTAPGNQVSMSAERDAEVLMPETELNYINGGINFTEATGVHFPFNFIEVMGADRWDMGVRAADVNGDGLIDFIKSCGGHGNPADNGVYLNNGSTWILSEDWDVPLSIVSYGEYENRGLQTFVVDINGDNLVDLIRWHSYVLANRPGTPLVYINTGSNWVLDESWVLPHALTDVIEGDWGVRLADINGDGLIDFLISLLGDGNVQTREVYINSGSNWVLDESWEIPVIFSFRDNTQGVNLVDVNNDNLVDIVRGYEDFTVNINQIYLNNGHGWVLDESWQLPVMLNDWRQRDLGVRFADINGDGYEDVMRASANDNNQMSSVVYLNNGHGWVLDEEWQLPYPFTDYVPNDVGTRLLDVNSDGVIDIIRSWYESGQQESINGAHLNNSKIKNLEFINNAVDKDINLVYQASAQSRDIGDALANPKLPYIIQTVKQINVFDGMATTTIDYNYSGGEQYFDSEHPRDKKFAGFSEVEKTIGNQVSKTYYQQANETNSDLGESTDTYAKIGKVYRQEIYDLDTLQSASIQKWQESALNNNRQFVYNTEKSQSNFSISTISTASQYDYNITNGNLLTENNLGQVELNTNTGEILNTLVGDEKTTTYDYATNEVKHILSAPKEKIITDTIDAKSQALYYDDLPLGQVNEVNLTKEDYLIDNVEINRAFNNYGLVISETDPENNVSNIVYDENNLYPASTTNALNQTNYTEYNLLNGQVTQAISPNGAQTVNTYDAFGRLIKTEVSSANNPSELVIKQEIVYQDWELPRYKETKDYFDVNQYKISREYYDGLDRVIQTKMQTANVNQWSTQDISYDTLGRVKHETLFYITDSLEYSLPMEVIYESVQLTPDEFEIDANTISLWHMNGLVDSAEKKDNQEGSSVLNLVENNAPASIYGFNEITDGAYNLDKDLHQYLSVSDQAALDITGDLTIDAWVKFASLPDIDDYYPIVSKCEQVNNNQSYFIGLRNDGGTMKLYWRISSDGGNNNASALGYSWVPDINRWYYITATYDSSEGDVRLYINSQNVLSDFDQVTSIYNSNVEFRIGSVVNLGFSAQYFDGVIDEVNISTRIKTPEEIYDYYNVFSDPILSFPAKTYTYDALNRVLTEITPVGTTIYEYNGLTTTIYDANSHRKDLVKDAYGNLVQVKEYNGQDVYTTSYEYSLTNKLIKITDALGNIRNFVYDDLDNLVSQDMIHLANAQNIPTITYTYDKNGNVLTETNFNNQTIAYTYDDLNRVLTESVNGSTKITYTYDQGTNNVGKLTYINYNHNGNWQSYNYNLLNQLTDYDVRIHGDNYAMNYGYNLNSDLKQIDYPNSKQANYTFNNIGQVAGVSVNASPITNNLQYNINGQLVHLERANGLITDYSYTPSQAYRLTNLSTTNATSTLQNISYTYDAVGNILNITDDANTDLKKSADYQYDDLNRLVSTTVNYLNIPASNYSQSFSYDAIGNILSNSALDTYNYTYANPQQLSSIGTQDFTYDNAGNLTNDENKTLTWDWRSRLTKSQDLGADKFTNYSYDANNQRLAKISKTQRLDIEPEIINIGAAATAINKIPPADISNEITLSEEHYIDQYFERNDINNDTKDHVYLNGQKIATINNNNPAYYTLSDHLGSSDILVGSNGQIAQVSDYTPFGSSAYTNTITELNNDYEFTGKEKDEETDLQYFGARYYNNLGKFISIDPVVIQVNSLAQILSDPQSLNAYAYSRNNPVILVDRDGNFWQIFTAAAGAVVGAACAAPDVYNLFKYSFQGNLDQASASSERFLNKTFAGMVAGLTLGEVAKPLVQTYAPSTYNAINGGTLPVLTNKVGDPGQGYYPNRNVGFRLDSQGRILDGENPANGTYKTVVRNNSVIFGKEKSIPGGGNDFSHADLVNGENVNFAGTMKFKNGQLQSYNEWSGHYQGQGNQWVLEKQFQKSNIDYSNKFVEASY